MDNDETPRGSPRFFPLAFTARIHPSAGSLWRKAANRVTHNPAYLSRYSSLEEALDAQNGRRPPKIILDNNMGGGPLRFLRRHGFKAIHIGDTRDANAQDEHIYERARALGAIIVTHDNDFARFGRFDITNSPGVVIMPASRKQSNSLEENEVLRTAFEHFAQTAARRLQEWRATVTKYRGDGKLVIYQAPLEWDEAGRAIPGREGVYYQPSSPGLSG